MIKLEDFQKLDIKIGKVLSAERIEGSDKLIKLKVDLGQEVKQIVAGIAQFYDPGYLLNKELVILANLESRKLMGVESQGMLLAATDETGIAIISPAREVKLGSIVK